MKKFSLIIVPVVILGMLGLVLLSSCKKQSTSYNNPPPGSSNTITMGNNTFYPASKTISAGTTITWTNNSGVTHTVTSDTGTELNSGDLGGSGGSYQHTFNSTGTFNYHCVYHQSMGMTGSITVQ